jgi:hypothetical protein
MARIVEIQYKGHIKLKQKQGLTKLCDGKLSAS